MPSSFENKKRLKFVITLGVGRFFDAQGNDRIILEGFRSTADIDKAGGMMMSTLRAKIYGVKQADMNACTTLQWKPGKFIPNIIEVFAIDGPVETLVFAGNIINAWGDYNTMPDVFLQIQAQAAYFNQMLSSKPRSFQGAIDVAKVMGQIASDLGYTFENNGVSVILNDVYLANTGIEQAKELAAMAKIGFYIDDKILAITPNQYAPRDARTKDIPLISSSSGMVGYPTFDGVGVNFRTLFNPAVTFGGRVKIETTNNHAAGEWVVTSVAHHLSAEMPGGPWFSTVRGNTNGLAIVGGK